MIAWNDAHRVIWPNLGELAARDRNTLRLVFLDPAARTLYYDWEAVARMSVGAFRADVARAGAVAEVGALVDELSHASPDFKAMWQENDVSYSGHAIKDLRHPVLGTMSFEVSSFGVDGRQDLTMIVFLPANEALANRITSLLAG